MAKNEVFGNARPCYRCPVCKKRQLGRREWGGAAAPPYHIWLVGLTCWSARSSRRPASAPKSRCDLVCLISNFRLAMCSMKCGKLTIIIGLPGAGKSTLIKNLRPSVSGICVEDFHGNAYEDSGDVKNSRHFFGLIEALRTGRDCIIGDIAFCEPQRLNKLKEVVKEWIPNISFEEIYFENDPVKCKRNIEFRAAEKVAKDSANLDEFSKKYVVPYNVKARPIKP
jgi:predicted kinase